MVDKNTLLQEADIISLHIPLTPETKDFIGEAEFKLMQPHAILINTARGPIVNKKVLHEALRKVKLQGQPWTYTIRNLLYREIMNC